MFDVPCLPPTALTPVFCLEMGLGTKGVFLLFVGDNSSKEDIPAVLLEGVKGVLILGTKFPPLA